MLRVSDLQIMPAGRLALPPIHLELAEGEVGLVLGGADAGKSAILETIAVGQWPCIGKLSWRGRNLADMSPPARRRIGIGCAFQQPRVIAGLTVADHVVFGRNAAGRSREARLDVYGILPELQTIRNDFVGGLSRTNCRLADLARALAGNPKLLLLDELTADIGVTRMVDLVARLRRFDITLLIADRYPAPLLPLATKGLLSSGNQIVVEGTAADLGRDPRVVSICAGDLVDDI